MAVLIACAVWQYVLFWWSTITLLRGWTKQVRALISTGFCSSTLIIAMSVLLKPHYRTTTRNKEPDWKSSLCKIRSTKGLLYLVNLNIQIRLTISHQLILTLFVRAGNTRRMPIQCEARMASIIGCPQICLWMSWMRLRISSLQTRVISSTREGFEYVDLKAKYRPLVGNGSVLKGI